MEGYKLVISAKFDGVNYRDLQLDTINEKTLTSTSVIASQPIQDGNTMSDHMYRQPNEYNVSGIFSLNGSNSKDISYNIEGITNGNDRLTKIQDVFEYIKDNGILCDLTTLNNDGTTTRFKTRTGMALTRITWAESLNSMKYTLSFKEVRTVNIQEYETSPYQDPALPNVNMPVARSLGKVLVDSGNIDQYVIKALIDSKYIDEKTLEVMRTKGKGFTDLLEDVGITVIAGAVVLVIGISVAAGIVKFLGALGVTASVYPVGTIIAAAAAAIAAVVVLVTLCVRHNKEKKRIAKSFKLVKNVDKYFDKKGNLLLDKVSKAEPDASEFNRLVNLVNKVGNYVNQNCKNIELYTITNDINDNNERTVTLNIAGELYNIKFVKDTTTFSWMNVNADKMNEQYREYIKDPSSNKKPIYSCNQPWHIDVTQVNSSNGLRLENVHKDSIISDFSEGNRSTNALFVTPGGEYEVYILNPSARLDLIKEESDEELYSPYYVMFNVLKTLYGYSIIVSKGNIQDNWKKVNEAIVAALADEGFE